MTPPEATEHGNDTSVFRLIVAACSAYSAEVISDPATSFLQNPASANSVPRLRSSHRTPTAGEQSSTPTRCQIRIIMILLRGLPFKPVTESTGSSVAARHTFVILRGIKLCSGPRLSSAGKDGSRMCRSTRRRHIKGKQLFLYYHRNFRQRDTSS